MSDWGSDLVRLVLGGSVGCPENGMEGTGLGTVGPVREAVIIIQRRMTSV